MTDPVDTGELRAWAVDARDIATGGGSGPNLLNVCADKLTAAADEVDRLRGEADDAYRSGYALGREHAKAKAEMRLRAVIENAPHQIYSDDTACPAAYGEEDAVCTCWKADAL